MQPFWAIRNSGGHSTSEPMAIYHFKMQIISRSHGRSATAAAAYRGGYAIEELRTGQQFDYTRRSGVLDDTILAPNRAPDWAWNGQELWNHVELSERRKDAQVARENVVALPHELTLEQNRELLHRFVQEAYVRRGMAAQVSIHGAGREGDNRNIHGHILLTTRQVTRNGFKEKKTRVWNEKETLEEWREQWAKHLNRALERAGFQERVDHRSYQDRGEDKMATHHLGPDASKLEKSGHKTRIGDENRAAREFNETMAQKKAELEAVEALIAQEQERLQQDSKELVLEQEFSGQSAEKSVADLEQERDPDNEAEVEPVVGEAAALEKQRLNQMAKEEAAELARAQAESERFLERLDRQREREAAEGARRDALRRELDAFYERDQVEAELRDAEERLAGASGFFSRLIGRQARWEQEVAMMREKLENIRQREAEAQGRLERDIAQARKRDGFEAGRSPSPAPSAEKEKSRDQSAENGPKRREDGLREALEASGGLPVPEGPSNAPEGLSGPQSGHLGSGGAKSPTLSSEFSGQGDGERTAGDRSAEETHPERDNTGFNRRDGADLGGLDR